MVCLICLLEISRLVQPEATAVAPSEPFTEPRIFQITFARNLGQTEGEEIPPISGGERLPILPDTEGHRFLGWNTDPGGQGTRFQPGDPFDLELSREQTLFAQWEDIRPAEETEETIPEETMWEAPESFPLFHEEPETLQPNEEGDANYE